MPKIRKKQRSDYGKRLVNLILAFNDYGDGEEAFSEADHPKRLKALAKSTDEDLEKALLARLASAIDEDETGEWINNLPNPLVQYCVEQNLLQEEGAEKDLEGDEEEEEEDDFALEEEEDDFALEEEEEEEEE